MFSITSRVITPNRKTLHDPGLAQQLSHLPKESLTFRSFRARPVLPPALGHVMLWGIRLVSVDQAEVRTVHFLSAFYIADEEPGPGVGGRSQKNIDLGLSQVLRQCETFGTGSQWLPATSAAASSM